MFSRDTKKRKINDDQDDIECPICYEKINNKNEILFTCNNCKKKFGLNCILKSCNCYWNRNEVCKCPYCRVELQDDSMLKDINIIENETSSLWKIYQDNIDRAIQNSYSMGDSDISKVDDIFTLNKIRQLQDSKAKIIYQMSLKHFVPEYDNPLRRGGKLKKKHKTRKNKKKYLYSKK